LYIRNCFVAATPNKKNELPSETSDEREPQQETD